MMLLFLIMFLEVATGEWRVGGVGEAQAMTFDKRGIRSGPFAILAAHGPGFTLPRLACG